MPELDRGSIFGGYYKVDPAKPRELFGIEWLNAFPCGEGVTFFLFYKDFLKGAGESIDVDAGTADLLTPDMEVKPIVQYLMNLDEEQGFTFWEIVERRAGIMVPQFLGFLRDDLDEYEQVEVTDEEGVKHLTDNIRRCSFER